MLLFLLFYTKKLHIFTSSYEIVTFFLQKIAFLSCKIVNFKYDKVTTQYIIFCTKNYKSVLFPAKMWWFVTFSYCVEVTCPLINGANGSVVEPFNFGPALAPAIQDGGSGFSPVVHNLLMKKKFRKISLLNLPACFIHRNVRVPCFALTVLYLQLRNRVI